MFSNQELVQEMDHLRKFAFKLTRNVHDAEDLLQSTLLRAMEKRHLYKETSKLFSWVSKIMYNLFVSAYRRKTKFETQYDPETYIEKQSVEPEQEDKIEIKNVAKAMDELPRKHKDILVMVCVKGMQYAEVSQKKGIPVGTVRSRLFRARENLKMIMSSDNANNNNQLTAIAA